MTPSVGGRRKVVVAALLVVSAAATGALAGFAAGVAWLAARLPAIGGWWVLVLVVSAAALDLAAQRVGAARPLSVGRQVPREWSRYFAPETVAVLYGARLGVGPATILPTWLWWAVVVLAASAGPGASAAAGAVFGAGRTLLMVALAEWVHRAAAARMARVRALEPVARPVVLAAAVVLATLAV